jgi:multiple sugar transport system substrate-binding protein
VLPLTEWQMPIILALQAGAPLLRGDGEYGDFRAPQVRSAFDFYLAFFRLGVTPTTAQTANLYRDFVNGDFACFVSGPWSIGELRARAPADFESRWATAPLPNLGGDGIGVSLAGGASLAMFAGSPRKEAAWRWMAFLSQAEQQSEFFTLTGDLPARASAWESERIITDPVIGAFRRQLDHVHATPKVPEWERIASKVSQHIESLARNRTSLDASLITLDAEVDAILAKRRWMLQLQAGRMNREAGA